MSEKETRVYKERSHQRQPTLKFPISFARYSHVCRLRSSPSLLLLGRLLLTDLSPSQLTSYSRCKEKNKKEGRKEGGERTIERGSESRDFLSVRVSSTSSFFLFAFFPPSARTLPRTADFPPLHVHHLDEINPDPLKSWMLMEPILDLSS